jgi:hypothetical protein
MWVIGRKVRDMSQPFTHAHGPEPLAFVMDVSYPGGWSTLGKNHELVGVIGEYFDFPLWNDITGFTQVSIAPTDTFVKQRYSTSTIRPCILVSVLFHIDQTWDWDLSSDYSGKLGMNPNDGRDDTPWPYTLSWARVPIMDMISVRIGGRAE